MRYYIFALLLVTISLGLYLQCSPTTAVVPEHTVLLIWTASGDDGPIGRANIYDLRKSDRLQTLLKWDQATKITLNMTPKSSSEQESCYVKLPSNKTTYLAIKTVDDAGNVSDMSNIGIYTKNSGNTLSLDFDATHPSLYPSYPTPFFESTTIPYYVPRTTYVDLAIYNTLGQKVKILVDDVVEAGDHWVEWDGTNEENTHVSAGAYFYVLRCNDTYEVKKTLHLK